MKVNFKFEPNELVWIVDKRDHSVNVFDAEVVCCSVGTPTDIDLPETEDRIFYECRPLREEHTVYTHESIMFKSHSDALKVVKQFLKEIEDKDAEEANEGEAMVKTETEGVEVAEETTPAEDD
jgi:hypothetical protein